MLQEDDEHTIDEDEAQITEAERNEELAALQAEADLPLDDILKMYTETKGDLQQQFSFTHFHSSIRRREQRCTLLDTQLII